MKSTKVLLNWLMDNIGWIVLLVVSSLSVWLGVDGHTIVFEKLAMADILKISNGKNIGSFVFGSVSLWGVEFLLFLMIYPLAIKYASVPGEGGIAGLYFIFGGLAALAGSYMVGGFILPDHMSDAEMFWKGFFLSFVFSFLPFFLLVVAVLFGRLRGR